MTSETSSMKRARVALTIAKDSMSATVILRAPQEGDPPITVQEVEEELAAKEVTYGVDHETIERMVANNEYNTPTKIAEGLPPERGENSKFEYHFDTDQDHRPKEDDDGHIDYRNINFIQNTDKGTVLATKVRATPGKPGTNVRGKEIKGPDGRDLPFNNGLNTEVSEDGMSLLAAASGAIQYKYGKVAVNDVLTIHGDVDHTVGNLNCKGTVRVTGDVKAGFEVKVDADVEVNGKVEDSTIIAGGNIYVKGGFFGKSDGIMKAEGNVTVKFAEGQRIESGNDVTIGGEAINCIIEAGQRVLVKGRRGKVVGGQVRAGTEIRAAQLGSETGTLTSLTVAYDAELIDRYNDIIFELKRIKEDNARVKEALYSLYRAQIDGALPPDKQAALEKLEKFRKDMPDTVNELMHQKKEIEDEIAKNKDAVIVAEDILYSGVKASFGIVYREILEDYKCCKLTLDSGKVLVSDYKTA
jgi:uncharacterized protein (DUF342 family)